MLGACKKTRKELTVKWTICVHYSTKSLLVTESENSNVAST